MIRLLVAAGLVLLAVLPAATAPAQLAPCAGPHDTTRYHPLIDWANNCYESHSHGRDDPAQLDYLLGPVVAHTGAEIAYPWTTSTLENQLPAQYGKHTFFVWLVYTNQAAVGPYNLYVRNLRVEVHADSALGYLDNGASIGPQSRFHSFAYQAEICSRASGQCGLVESGGHAGGTTIEFSDGGRWCVDNVTGTRKACATGGPSISRYVCPGPATVTNPNLPATQVWYNSPASGNSLNAQVSFEINDPWSYATLDQPGTIHLYGSARPDFNGSRIGLHTLSIKLRQSWDQNATVAGIQYNGFTTVAGVPDASCVAASATCVRTVISGVPAGDVQYRPTRNGIGSREMDECMALGLSCIVYPYQ